MRWARWCSILAAVVVTAGACGVPSAESNADRLVVDSWGGDFQAAQSDLLFDPFGKQNNLEVVELSDGESIYAKVRSQRDREPGDIDLVHGDASWLARGKQENLWAPIDYSIVPRDALFDDVVEDHGVGILYWSFNIVTNTGTVQGQAPRDWAAVWDYALAHPGRVAMWSARPNYVLEAALMADGVPAAEVYPLDDAKLDRAYRSLDRIRNNVQWYENGGQGLRLYTEGQVDTGLFYGGDAQAAIRDGAPLEVEWNQGVYTRDYWMVPANAPNRERAMELIAFALDAGRQAQFAERTGYGPVSLDSEALIPENVRTTLTSAGQNKSAQLSYDSLWWGANDDRMFNRWNSWLRG